MSLLEVRELTVQYGDHIVVDHVNLQLERGQWLMLIGPNGAGKSTIVNAISQAAPYTGTILYAGKDLRRTSPRELARQIGVLSQKHSVGYSFTVGEVVRLGRYAYSKGLFSAADREERQMVEQAMEMTGVRPLMNQSVLTLSGGELQRTFLAQLFAQDPEVLILDEPTNHLDLIYQKQVFELIETWRKKTGRAVISVVHDLSLARAYGTHALLLNHSHVVAEGTTAEVFAPGPLNQAYGMDVRAWMQTMLRQWE